MVDHAVRVDFDGFNLVAAGLSVGGVNQAGVSLAGFYLGAYVGYLLLLRDRLEGDAGGLGQLDRGCTARHGRGANNQLGVI